MATLAANASAIQERLKVSAIPAGDYFQIDDEIVRVIDKRTTQLTILVERAYAGTTAATHNSGATLTPLYVPSTGGGGGISEEDHDQLQHTQLWSLDGMSQVNVGDVVGVRLQNDSDDTVVHLAGGGAGLLISSDVVIIELPTVNPNNPGQLWNDGGTVKVS